MSDTERFRYKNVGRDFRADNAKGCLIMLVVIGHFLLPLERTRFITNLFFLIYAFHMPCFVLISGHMARGLYQNGRFRYLRLVQIFWLYLIYKVILFFTEIPAYGPTTPFPDFFHESGAPWYLISMCVWYLLVLLMRRFRKFPLNLLALSVLTALCLAGGYLKGIGYFLSLDRTISFAPFFFTGYYLSRDNLDTFYESGWSRVFIAAGGVLALFLMFGGYDYLGHYQLAVFGSWYETFNPAQWRYAWLIRLAWYGVAFTMSFGFLAAMTRRQTYVFTELGQRTLQIYILHRPVRDLCLAAGLFSHVNIHSKFEVLLLVFACVLLTIALSALPLKWVFDFVRLLPERIIRYTGAWIHRKRRGRHIADKYQIENIRKRIEERMEFEEL